MTETKMQLKDWLDDLCVRFIINLPQEDLSTVSRICFQVEEAQWFYEDFIRPLDPTLPSMSLRSFCLRIFQHCPLLASFSVENHMKAFEEFLQYKTRVPVRGAILLNEAMDSTVLVKGWKKGANWSFPRGKINKDEDDLDCAIREVYEETGFDIRAAGLVPAGDEVKYIEIAMREQQMRLYVFRNVPMDTYFEPKTRKEISKIQWYSLSELPAFRKKGNQQTDAAAASNANKFYMVAPFLVPLKKWVVQQRKKDGLRAANNMPLAAQPLHEETLTEDDVGVQTEPIKEHPRVTPAIDTLEGATRELQRLLKVQPPTQGLQPVPTAASGHNKGDALLALLQKGARQAPAPAAPAHNPNPHTPLDLTYANPPQPHTPHHHHPTQLAPISSYQAPPSFPLPPHSNQTASAAYSQQNQVPHMAHQLNYHGHYSYGRDPSQQARHVPVPLMHPQPLPPQVQKTLLHKGMLPSPGIPDNRVNTIQVTSYHAQSGLVPGPVPPQSSENKQQQPLSSRATAMLANLNVVQQGESKDAGESARGQQYAPPSQVQDHQASGSSSGPALGSQLLADLAAKLVVRSRQLQTNDTARFAPSTTASNPPIHTDTHRSTLLDMFKQMPSSEAPGAPRAGGVDGALASPATRPAPQAAPTASAAKPTGSANGGRIQMNTEPGRPLDALSILTRPKGTEARANINVPAPHQHEARRLPGYSPGAGSAVTVKPGFASPREAVPPSGRTHTMGRTAPAVAQPHQSYLANLPQASSSYAGIPPPQSSNLPSSGAGQSRQDIPADQKQKLLSLFGKSPAFGPDSRAKGKEPMVPEHAQGGPAYGRLATLGPAGGGDGRGSADMPPPSEQTPMSPADRNFLLGYLESVSNGATR